MLKILFSVLCTCLVTCCAAIDFKDLDKITYKSLDDWLQQVNDQYLQLNHFSASFAWDLIVDPDSKVLGEASELGKYRAKWQNQRCAEARDMSTDGMTQEHRRMIWILCRGPKYTEYQGGELSKMLNRIQDIYTESKVCLPKGFDVCVNYNRIWEYTYLKTPNEDLVELDLTNVVPRLAALEQNPLNYFDGNVTNDYYVFRGIKDLSSIPSELETDEKIRSSQPVCLDIENGLEKIMAGNFSSLQRPDCAMPQDVIMLWAWESWRLAVGPAIGEEYPNAVYMMNVGAQNNGYNDIGECWREELEIPDLESVTKQFWHKIKPYYQLLHGVLRNVLRKKYEHPGDLKEYGPIPAHLLGNMWSQDWSSYHKLLSPFSEVYIDDNFRKTNWSNLDMVKRAEDFYSSMGLNPMTEKFWKNSKFEKTRNSTKCHGSAGNMFTGDDYRMIVCAERNLNDFYVIVHEMGHIEYYMHVQKQPALFQDATNSAFGEAIGDAVFLGIVTPQHLNRLGLLNDKFLAPTKRLSTREMRVVHETKEMPEFLFAPKISKESFAQTFTINGRPYPDFDALNAKMDSFMQFKDSQDRSINAFDLSHLLRIALEKIPHIPFEFILDQWRWKFFKGDISKENANDYFWKLSIEEQGIHPPNWVNRHEMFDVAAKYHLADNTPYVRYFLSSFLQVQVFKGLCEKTIFGKFNTGQKLPMPLHRCDIYGSKRAGRILKKALSLGSSVHWSEVLYILTGSRELSVEPLLEYYQPLFAWLEKLALEYDIPIGW